MQNNQNTSNLQTFKEQVKNPNKIIPEKKKPLVPIKKNLVIAITSDYTGCGHIRNILPSLYSNAVFGSSGDMQIISTPTPINDPDILKRTRSILFQRTMGNASVVNLVTHFKELQRQFKYKLVYDIDDFIWDGPEDGEDIPEYNFGKNAINDEVQQSAITIMKMMDIVTVSTQFLKDYIATLGVDNSKIIVLHNTLPSFLWGNMDYTPKVKKITKPRILWSSSPTHWHDGQKLYGDMDNAWREWVIKSVNEDKIEYIQMGGLPWFFEEIKDKITVIPWVNSLQYPGTIKSIRADIGIAPLVANYFNYSKSAIKYQEYCISGIVGVGTVFSNGKTSPYDVSVNTATDDITVEEIDHMIFDVLCEPDMYNKVIQAQFDQVKNNGWTTESSQYVNLLTSIL